MSNRFVPARPALTAAAVTLLISACAGDPAGGGNTDQAEIRLLHASAGIGGLDLEVAGRTVATGIGYGRGSQIALVPAGRQQIVVREGSRVVGQLEALLDEDMANTVVAVNGGVQFATQVEADTGAVAPSRANIRFVIAAAENQTAPTQLNALMSGTSLPNDSTMRFGIDATTARYWTLMYFDPGRFTIKYVPLNTNGPVLTETTFDVARGETKAVVLRRETSGQYRVEVVTEQ